MTVIIAIKAASPEIRGATEEGLVWKSYALGVWLFGCIMFVIDVGIRSYRFGRRGSRAYDPELNLIWGAC